MKINLLTSTIVALSAFVSFNASAYDAYNLHSDKWAVECSDGELAAFSGDETGLKNAGSSLCESHGGIAGAKEDIVVKKFADTTDAESPLTEGRAGDSAPTAAATDGANEKDQAVSKDETPAKDAAASTETPAEDTKK